MLSLLTHTHIYSPVRVTHSYPSVMLLQECLIKAAPHVHGNHSGSGVRVSTVLTNTNIPNPSRREDDVGILARVEHVAKQT